MLYTVTTDFNEYECCKIIKRNTTNTLAIRDISKCCQICHDDNDIILNNHELNRYLETNSVEWNEKIY